MSNSSADVLPRLVRAIDDFAKGIIGLDDIQGRLQSAMSLLESNCGAALNAIRSAEADIEEIRFTMLKDEQRPAVVFRLDDLRATLEEEPGLGS